MPDGRRKDIESLLNEFHHCRVAEHGGIKVARFKDEPSRIVERLIVKVERLDTRIGKS